MKEWHDDDGGGEGEGMRKQSHLKGQTRWLRKGCKAKGNHGMMWLSVL